LVTPDPSSSAKKLLARLYRAEGAAILSGQDNAASAATPLQGIAQITGKDPVIYGLDLGATPDSAKTVVEEAKRQHDNRAPVTLSWRPASPTGGAPDSKLTDFEWHELLTPGTVLYQHWCAQVDEIAGHVRKLDDGAVLWRPYPQSNSDKFWWAGRKGSEGSAALYRQLFDRLVSHDKLHNLIWIWEAVPAGFGPNAPGEYSDFFPGLLYVDALQVDARGGNRGPRRDQEMARFGVGKVIGLGLDGWVPEAATLEQSKWAWFLISSDTTAAPGNADALRTLYASPHVESTPAGVPVK
jgi:mannan endo-1,4-beta-mannosidase